MSAPVQDRGEAGFTLVEMLVAMAMSIPVLLALVAILVGSLHQTGRTIARVDATRQARNAMTTIENELHSACIGSNTDPILPSSTPTSLQFLSYTGTDDTPTPVWNVLALQANANTSPTTYSLVDTTYNVTANSNVANIGWTQGSQSGQVTLLTNVTPNLQNGAAFGYYAYQDYPVGSVFDWIIPDGTNLQPGTTATYPNTQVPSIVSGGVLNASDAADVVEIVLGLTVGPSNPGSVTGTTSGVTDPVNDAISLRLTTPPNSSTRANDTGDYGPCE